jgi:hypothetical protein
MVIPWKDPWKDGILEESSREPGKIKLVLPLKSRAGPLEQLLLQEISKKRVFPEAPASFIF